MISPFHGLCRADARSQSKPPQASLLLGDLRQIHGEIRLAVEGAPSDELFPCPVCGSPCLFTLLGEGGTHRPLPFWDEIRDSLTLKELIGGCCRAQKAQVASASA
jgi:hypothetical protein